jgi:hypothetical protein
LLDIEPRTGERTPALLAISDQLVETLVKGTVRAGAERATGDLRGRKLEVELPVAPSFARISGEVERQYLRAMFRRCHGDLERMARELLGPRGTARQVHLRLNQLGLKLRELRAELA